MTLSLRLTAVVLAVFALLTPAALAAKPTPQQVADRAVVAINNVIPGTQRQLTNTTTATVNAVTRLDAAGKPTAAIEQAGARGTLRINTLQTANTAQVNRRKDAAVKALNRINADAALIQQVNDAAAAAIATISTSADASRSTIQSAVTSAIGS
jgi:hypothetical protein